MIAKCDLFILSTITLTIIICNRKPQTARADFISVEYLKKGFSFLPKEPYAAGIIQGGSKVQSEKKLANN